MDKLTTENLTPPMTKNTLIRTENYDSQTEGIKGNNSCCAFYDKDYVPISGFSGCSGELKHQYEIDFENLYPTLANSFKTIQKEQYKLFATKMLDYGINNISLGEDMDEPENIDFSHKGVLIRCLDKINRLKNLVFKNQQNHVKDENILDTWKDLGNYSIIAQIILKSGWKK